MKRIIIIITAMLFSLVSHASVEGTNQEIFRDQTLKWNETSISFTYDGYYNSETYTEAERVLNAYFVETCGLENAYVYVEPSDIPYKVYVEIEIWEYNYRGEDRVFNVECGIFKFTLTQKGFDIQNVSLSKSGSLSGGDAAVTISSMQYDVYYNLLCNGVFVEEFQWNKKTIPVTQQGIYTVEAYVCDGEHEPYPIVQGPTPVSNKLGVFYDFQALTGGTISGPTQYYPSEVRSVDILSTSAATEGNTYFDITYSWEYLSGYTWVALPNETAVDCTIRLKLFWGNIQIRRKAVRGDETVYSNIHMIERVGNVYQRSFEDKVMPWNHTGLSFTYEGSYDLSEYTIAQNMLEDYFIQTHGLENAYVYVEPSDLPNKVYVEIELWDTNYWPEDKVFHIDCNLFEFTLTQKGLVVEDMSIFKSGNLTDGNATIVLPYREYEVFYDMYHNGAFVRQIDRWTRSIPITQEGVYTFDAYIYNWNSYDDPPPIAQGPISLSKKVTFYYDIQPLCGGTITGTKAYYPSIANNISVLNESDASRGDDFWDCIYSWEIFSNSTWVPLPNQTGVDCKINLNGLSGNISLRRKVTRGGETAYSNVHTIQSKTVSFSKNRNYIASFIPQDKDAAFGNLAVQYYDGLGRPVETIQVGANPDQNDLVTYQEYDEYGRESKAWLPAVTKGNNGTFISYSNFVEKALNTYAADMNPFSKVVYDASPLNQIIEQYGPGQEWHDNERAVRPTLLPHDQTHPCRLYTITDDIRIVEITRSSNMPNYLDKQLYITELSDEDYKVSYEFKDKQGKVILTRQMDGTVSHDTYYVYDSYENLRAVLPPLATDALNIGTWGESNTYLQQYAYLYKYDKRNRCIAKKLPGADWTYYIYDKADRLIFSQDGEQRFRNEWTFNIYDTFGRLVLSGTCNNTLNYLTQLDSTVTGIWRNRIGGYKGYTIDGIELVNPNLLTVNYYDSYDFMGKNDIPTSTHNSYKFDELSGFSLHKTKSETGLQTGTLTAIEESGSVKFLLTTMYYDYRGRLIQTHSDNHLKNGVDKNYVSHNFIGQPVRTQHVHSAEGKPTLTEYSNFTYDHAGRLLKTEHQLKYNNVLNDKVTLTECTYNDLGRLKNKILHNNSADPIAYAHNIRGWLIYTLSNNFHEGLSYGIGSLYNGNISSVIWRTGMSGMRGYKFVYDGLNRLTEANYGEGIYISNNMGRFTERITEYDKHGNIKGIERYGKTAASQYGLVDKLSFGYSGNHMTFVNDQANVSSTGQGFHFINGDSSMGNEYQYNANGNLIKDSNKNITNIQYNLLNLPIRVELSGNRSATYLYDAAGIKRKVTHLGGGISKSTDYCSNVIYENGQLDKILTNEGYITLSGFTPTYHYYLKDHLGNVRVVQHQDGVTIEQANHYYPFGGLFDQTSEDAQRYKYNGKELDRTYGIDLYDYSARYMDGALGRFTTMDPMAEKYYSISPYAYCANNPMRFVDPTGEDIWDFLGGIGRGAENKVVAIGNAIAHPIETIKQIGTNLGQASPEDIGLGILDLYTAGIVSSNIEFFSAVASDINGGDGSATGEVLGGVAVDVAIAAATAEVGSLVGKGTSATAKTVGETTKVGRWMSKIEYSTMSKTQQMVEGAGGKTSVSTGGPNAFKGAVKGSVYAEFEVPTKSLVQGGQSNWYSVIGPNANKVMKSAVYKQGGSLLNEIQVKEITPILKTK